jgi:hypothetical protein
MPSEFRFVVFTTRELQRALIAQALRSRKQLPQGSVAGLVIQEGEPPAAVLTIEPNDGGKLDAIFEADEIVEAMINFCIDRRIPLPREPEKVLELFQGRLALRVMFREHKVT